LGWPVSGSWQNLGLGLGAAGVALVAVQLTRPPGTHPWFEQPLGLVGISLIALGALTFFVGFFMSDDVNKGLPEANGRLIDRPRAGYKVRGRGKVKSQDARIRNQDTAVDVAEDGEFEGERTDIG